METKARNTQKSAKLQTTLKQTSYPWNVEAGQDQIHLEKTRLSQKSYGSPHGQIQTETIRTKYSI